MPTKISVSQGDFTLEAAFEQPDFGLFHETRGLIPRVFRALRPHGVKLSDMKIERGSGTLSEFHLVCQLFNYAMSVRTRIDRVEVTCIHLSDENVKRFAAAIVDALVAVQGDREPRFQTYSLMLSLHGTLEGADARSFLAGFSAKTPQVGPSTGNAVGYYFGPTDERLASTVILDISAAVSGGIYMQLRTTWDATKVRPQNLPALADTFVRAVFESVGLDAPKTT